MFYFARVARRFSPLSTFFRSTLSPRAPLRSAICMNGMNRGEISGKVSVLRKNARNLSVGARSGTAETGNKKKTENLSAESREEFPNGARDSVQHCERDTPRGQWRERCEGVSKATLSTFIKGNAMRNLL